MRKLIVAFAFMVITLTSYAQSGSEHLTFKGIPIEGSMTEILSKVKKQRIYIYWQRKQSCIVYGRFYWS